MLSHPENSRKQESIINHRTHFHPKSVTVVTVVTVFSAYPSFPFFRGKLLYIIIYNNLNIYTYNLIAANSQYTPSAENCHNCHAVTPFALSLLCISYSTKFRYL